MILAQVLSNFVTVLYSWGELPSYIPFKSFRGEIPSKCNEASITHLSGVNDNNRRLPFKLFRGDFPSKCNEVYIAHLGGGVIKNKRRVEIRISSPEVLSYDDGVLCNEACIAHLGGGVNKNKRRVERNNPEVRAVLK